MFHNLHVVSSLHLARTNASDPNEHKRELNVSTSITVGESDAGDSDGDFDDNQFGKGPNNRLNLDLQTAADVKLLTDEDRDALWWVEMKTIGLDGMYGVLSGMCIYACTIRVYAPSYMYPRVYGFVSECEDIATLFGGCVYLILYSRCGCLYA